MRRVPLGAEVDGLDPDQRHSIRRGRRRRRHQEGAYQEEQEQEACRGGAADGRRVAAVQVLGRGQLGREDEGQAVAGAGQSQHQEDLLPVHPDGPALLETCPRSGKTCSTVFIKLSTTFRVRTHFDDST